MGRVLSFDTDLVEEKESLYFNKIWRDFLFLHLYFLSSCVGHA